MSALLLMLRGVWGDKSSDRKIGVLAALLHRGLNVDERIQGRTMLHAAIEFGELGVAEFLLEQGADLDAVDEKEMAARSRLERFFTKWPGAASGRLFEQLQARTGT